MANGLNKHHILEAIDKLRSRKSRPDAVRIVSYVAKKYEFPKNDINEYLETLSRDGTVLKVEFKGNFSYRNAANHRNTKNVSSGNHEESSKGHESISDLVAGALAQLIVEEPDYLDVGISMKELYEHLDPKRRKQITKSYFKEILLKEVKNGNLVKFENGNYCLGYPTGEHNSISSVSDISQNSTDKDIEKSKSPIHTVRKYSSLSRHSSPSSSKHSSRSSSALSDKHSSTHGRPAGKAYTKASKRMSKVFNRGSGMNKCEVSPGRETSRRKRFQKIVFDPSDNLKPKKLKDKKQAGLIQQGRIRGPYKKYPKDLVTPDDKTSIKKVIPSSSSRHSTRSSTADIKLDAIESKEEILSEEESDEGDSSAESVNTCKICGFNIDFKSNRNLERWTSCHFCGRKAHVTCIEDTEQWTRLKLSKWQCNDCKSCVVCKKTKFGESDLVLCGLCDDAYHVTCGNIKKVKLNQKWFCGKCSGVFSDGIKTEKEDFGSREMTSNECSQRTTPEPDDSKTEKDELPYEKKGVKQENREGVDESIPDCTNWSCDEVYSYFLKYVLPEEANVFKDQEIDGRVLLLLTRCDVLSDFKLKLGPALKIYAQVKKLQEDSKVKKMTDCKKRLVREKDEKGQSKADDDI